MVYFEKVLFEIIVLGIVVLEGGIVGFINRIKMNYKMIFVWVFFLVGSIVVICLLFVVSLMINLNYYFYEGI